jgi:hypothetical protein
MHLLVSARQRRMNHRREDKFNVRREFVQRGALVVGREAERSCAVAQAESDFSGLSGAE